MRLSSRVQRGGIVYLRFILQVIIKLLAGARLHLGGSASALGPVRRI